MLFSQSQRLRFTHYFFMEITLDMVIKPEII
jgi:hypothetical protein